ncbi:MAG: ATP synthase F1 subunit delta [Desulfurivibrionaceae bacterium]|nr:ATP synthase F1 subunit delta [Desulfobulbales bacterium]MDT8334773.1 ATP synthase F1 subunit delta [Desulfurivibrionaceae bacterium]
MNNTVLAKRYAKALFQVGKEEDLLDDFNGALAEMERMYNEVPEIGNVLTNPFYPQDVREKVMVHLVEALRAPALMANFFNLLVQKRRADVLPDIAQVFRALVDAERNMCRGTVISAAGISSDLNDKIKATLEKITGKQVVVVNEVDPAIIGGIIARVGDLVLDGSIKTQLKGLEESIKGSE